jgi:hypothetical protein
MTMHRRGLGALRPGGSVALLVLGLGAHDLAAQGGKPALPPLTPPRLGADIPAPKALTPDQLARRLRGLGTAVPDVLPRGATTTLTPVALRVGRTWIDLQQASWVSPEPGRVVAQFAIRESPGSVSLEFDAPAGAVYVLDAWVHLWRPSSRFRLPETTPRAHVLEVVTTSPGQPNSVQTQSAADGHVVVAVRAGAAGRQRVTIRGTECCWSFYRLDLTRT